MHNLSSYDALMAIADGIEDLTGGRLGIYKIAGEDRLVYTDRSGKRFRGDSAMAEATVFYSMLWNQLSLYEDAKETAAQLIQENPALGAWEQYAEAAMATLSPQDVGPLVILANTKAKEFIEYTTYGWWADPTSGNEPFDTI